ncbi:glutathione peroxidase [Glycomyces sp. NRRL B-16210]|uniref:glutathione peroxidase n=1 Tax=Glycomyces sp. NRRL B-16210 TaxID=1463821 RepID=UPI00068BDA2A|nr:glutathione peroxidase [Glycomyces sp. NRRL B-16210]
MNDQVRLDGIGFDRMDGTTATLADFAGQVVLVVNTASKCGLTPQYEGLQRAHEEYRARGFTVLAFPANDFLGQEPGTDEEIADFCSVQYSVTFPVMSKIAVTGEHRHPLYAELTNRAPRAEGKAGDRQDGVTDDPEVQWNFEKFVIGRTGAVAARFAPPVAPDDPALRRAIETELDRG